MDKEEMKRLNLTPIEDYITEDYGAEGTPSRMEFEANVDAFILGEQHKAQCSCGTFLVCDNPR